MGPVDPTTREPGDLGTRRPGDQGIRRLGDQWTRGTRRPGDQVTRGPGDQGPRGPGDQETREPSDLGLVDQGTGGPGNQGTRGPGDEDMGLADRGTHKTNQNEGHHKAHGNLLKGSMPRRRGCQCKVTALLTPSIGFPGLPLQGSLPPFIMVPIKAH